LDELVILVPAQRDTHRPFVSAEGIGGLEVDPGSFSIAFSGLDPGVGRAMSSALTLWTWRLWPKPSTKMSLEPATPFSDAFGAGSVWAWA
jgi:hypothetical protein